MHYTIRIWEVKFLDVNNLLLFMDTLFKTALYKTRDADTAEELTQDTYLHTLTALSKGKQIDNPKAYMLSVMNNLFFMKLRQKYKLNTVYYDELPIESVYDESGFDAIIQSEEAKMVRRELAFLAKTYRDVMVLYYMKNRSVTEIAEMLSIPKGTVLSRLDSGRKIVRKGVETMEEYGNNSYQPEILAISINGRTGQNGEPFSCVKNSMDQNILIVAYKEPLTVTEISKTLGVPMAFVEESVDSLVKSELMKQIGTKVATDFVICSPEDRRRSVETGKRFANETFELANPVFLSMVEQYQAIGGFSSYNETQLYIQAVLSCRQSYIWRIEEGVTGRKTIDFEDYPDRPNYGKWLACGGLYPTGFGDDGERSKYANSGRSGTDDINEYIKASIEWDTAVGHTQQAKFKYSLSQRERALLIDAVRTDTVNAFQAELLPDFEKYGFIKTVNGKKIPAVPYITKEEDKRFFEIEREAGKAFCDACLDKAVKICRENPIRYPAHITMAPDWIYTEPMDLPMAYVYEAANRGIITLEADKSYPVMYIVTGSSFQ